MPENNKDKEITVPAIVQSWINEMNSPKSTDFAKDNYRAKLEGLRDYISKELSRNTYGYFMRK